MQFRNSIERPNTGKNEEVEKKKKKKGRQSL